MKLRLYSLTAAALFMTALTACSKPAETTADAAADATTVTADAATTATDPGGAVSPPPMNGNEAVNTDANTTDKSQSPGSNSFTENQARGQIENAGYSDVTELTKTSDGMWTGKAMRSGKTMNVSVDFKGAVTAK